jgi:hypothetical protein
MKGRRVALLARLVVLAGSTGQTTSAFAIHLARAGRLAWASAQIKMCINFSRIAGRIQQEICCARPATRQHSFTPQLLNSLKTAVLGLKSTTPFDYHPNNC